LATILWNNSAAQKRNAMEQNENSFLDKRTVFAIIIAGIFYFAWQNYLSHKYPQAAAKKEPTKITEKAAVTAAPIVNVSPSLPQTQDHGTFLHFSSQTLAFDISSNGMELKNFVLKEYSSRTNMPVEFGQEPGVGLFAVRTLEDQRLVPFKIESPEPNVFVGVAEIGAMKITRELRISPEQMTLANSLKIEKAPAGFKGVEVVVSEKRGEAKSSSFFMPNTEHQEFVVNHGGTWDRINISGSKERIDQEYTSVKTAGISTQYFTITLLDRSEIVPSLKTEAGIEKEPVTLKMIYPLSDMQKSADLKFLAYVGPKSYTHLKQIDPALAGVVNFGFFSGIGEILLETLKFFNRLVRNWGLSIILLTLLVRLLVLPFNVASYKSMKKMQKIQPQMAALRERYKEDPQTMNREVMALMKSSKVNPAGGCLPMLLQMPIFFALYQVLGQSIELYKAPFVGWIGDLSAKDPYFILPVLMGAAMFIQQKITPTTMDPAQAKIMQFLPLVFCMMMLALPSGLTLYMLVSTVFGVVQQQIFMKDKHNPVAVKEAKV